MPIQTLTALCALYEEQWPNHHRFLTKRFVGCTEAHLRMAETLAILILRLADGNLRTLVEDYRWHCDCLVHEQMHFMRTGTYQLSTFAEASAQVYENAQYMHRYMNALLLTQVLWSNHTEALLFYADRFLPNNAEHCNHLEIGPGHGLLLYFAALDRHAKTIEAWDVSDTSLAMTKQSLMRLGVERPVTLRSRDILTGVAAEPIWDSIVISEVLEHLEEPARALAFVRQSLRPNGRAFINVPVNCPAPDHIFLFSAPEEVLATVRASGLQPTETKLFPASGYTEDTARKQRATISCAVIATNPA